MKVKVLHSKARNTFEDKLNSMLEELETQGSEVVEINYTTAAINDQRIHHSALILYK